MILAAIGVGDLLLYTLLILVSVATTGAYLIWYGKRSFDMVVDWALRNGYHLTSCERRTFLTGPYFWRSAKGQAVFRIIAEDLSGTIRSGWVRCGSWWAGIWSKEVDVRWDD